MAELKFESIILDRNLLVVAQTGCHLGRSTLGHRLHKPGLTRKKRPSATTSEAPRASKL